MDEEVLKKLLSRHVMFSRSSGGIQLDTRSCQLQRTMTQFFSPNTSGDQKPWSRWKKQSCDSYRLNRWRQTHKDQVTFTDFWNQKCDFKRNNCARRAATNHGRLKMQFELPEDKFAILTERGYSIASRRAREIKSRTPEHLKETTPGNCWRLWLVPRESRRVGVPGDGTLEIGSIHQRNFSIHHQRWRKSICPRSLKLKLVQEICVVGC